MAYSSTNLKIIQALGIRGSMFLYSSSLASSDVTVTGFMKAAGAGGVSDNQGMRVGDVVIVQETTGGGTPGRTTIHGVKASTANQASTIASTGCNAGYDCSLSAT